MIPQLIIKEEIFRFLFKSNYLEKRKKWFVVIKVREYYLVVLDTLHNDDTIFPGNPRKNPSLKATSFIYVSITPEDKLSQAQLITSIIYTG